VGKNILNLKPGDLIQVCAGKNKEIRATAIFLDYDNYDDLKVYDLTNSRFDLWITGLPGDILAYVIEKVESPPAQNPNKTLDMYKVFGIFKSYL